MNELSTKCRHFGTCSGCVLSQNIHFPPIWEEVQKYFANRIHLEVGLTQGWRVKAKLAIRGDFDKPKIGLFKQGSHMVQRIPCCTAHHPSINRAVLILEEAIQQEEISLYDETKGLLKYAQFFVELATGRVQLTLVVQCVDASIHRLVTLLAQMDQWHSIWLNVQPLSTNRIIGDEWIHICGERMVSQTLLGKPFLFHPASFAQAHWTLFEKLASDVKGLIPEGAKLVELYAGVGVMGRLASDKAESVQLIENNPFSYESFQAGERKGNVTYHLEDASLSGHRLKNADCILVDPPRKGIDPKLLEAIQAQTGTLIYVSCDYLSFVRDANQLMHSGWALAQGKGYLLFPGTNHVETVAVFEKS